MAGRVSSLSEHERSPESGPEPRPYRMRARAEQVSQTRQRIVDAAVQLHGTVGPAATTIAAIADLAGVTRLTVYRHFPDEAPLFEACSAHWVAHHRPPDPPPSPPIPHPPPQPTPA